MIFLKKSVYGHFRKHYRMLLPLIKVHYNKDEEKFNNINSEDVKDILLLDRIFCPLNIFIFLELMIIFRGTKNTELFELYKNKKNLYYTQIQYLKN